LYTITRKENPPLTTQTLEEAQRTVIADALTVSVDQAAHLLGLSRASTYQAVAAGQLPSIRIGKRLLISRAALEAMLEPAEPGASSVATTRPSMPHPGWAPSRARRRP
jgi:excisionase family DNA binding protein